MNISRLESTAPERARPILRLFSGLLAVIVGLSLAGCSRSSADSPIDVHHLKGVLGYHHYSSYEAWDSTLWMADLATGKVKQVGKQWKTILSPMNMHFAPDGNSFTFMGSQIGLAENDWDVFVSKWNGSDWAEPINLTGPNGQRDEDPKFSPNGKLITFKTDGVMKTMSPDGSNQIELTAGQPESSMPYFTADGKGLLFERNGQILLLQDKKTTVMKSESGMKTYYPIVVDSDRFLYTQIQFNHHDAIYWGFYDGSDPQRLFFDDERWETADSYPYADGQRYLFYVSTTPDVLKGGYNVMVADLETKKVYDLDKICPGANSELLELGPAWSAKAQLPH